MSGSVKPGSAKPDPNKPGSSDLKSQSRGNRLALTAVALVMGCSGTTLAQDALGSGKALDGNLNTRSRFNGPRANFSEEVRYRNAIATGNAPGGMSFRGDVGYSSPYSFRGELGSNDTFAFRRDSLTSGLAGMGIRGTDALQYQFSLTTGGRPPARLVGGLVVNEAGSGASGTSLRRGPNSTDFGNRDYSDDGGAPAIQRRPDGMIDPSDYDTSPEQGSLLNTLRSPSAYLANRDYQPSLLTVYGSEREQNALAMIASPLRGVRMEPMGARPEQTGAGQTASSGATRTPPAGFIDPAKIDTSVTPRRTSTAYDDVIAGVRERMGLPEATPEEARQDPQWLSRIRELQLEILEGAEQNQTAPEAPSFDPKTVDAIRDTSGSLTGYVRPDPGKRNFYAEHVSAGQRLLVSGRYFDAEERFAHALGIKPGDVTAQIGRINAQISAGMFLSAAVNLRQLFFEHPEIIGTRFPKNMLPPDDRIDSLIAMLKRSTNLDQTGADVALASRQDAILLGYVAWQKGDLDLVARALDAYDTSISSSEEGLQADVRSEARLVALLRTVWIPGEATPDRSDKGSTNQDEGE